MCRYPDKEPLIRVGFLTQGAPQISRVDEGAYILTNPLIGNGFHWEGVERNLVLTPDYSILPEAEGAVGVVCSLPLERYVASVIGSEMNPEAPLEFLKAHAVISRSWALRKIMKYPVAQNGMADARQWDIYRWEESDAHTLCDVCNDDHCQRFHPSPEAENYCIDAIDATRGEVLLDNSDNHEIVDARFSKCCGGRTELFSSCWADTDYDYLSSIQDPWCDPSRISEEKRSRVLRSILKDFDSSTQDFYEWRTRISKKQISRNLIVKFGRDIGEVQKLEIVKRGESGRITKIRLYGSTGEIEIGKELMIRRLLSDTHLYSSWMDITEAGDDFILHGHGWGHGVGLCQIGAAVMAEEGYDYREILNFYFPNTSLKKLYV